MLKPVNNLNKNANNVNNSLSSVGEIDSIVARGDCSRSTNRNEQELTIAPSCLKKPPVVFRLDAVEFYIDVTKENANYLNQHFIPDFVEAIRRGQGGYVDPDFNTGFSIRPKEYWLSRYRMTAGSTKVEIFGPGILLGQLKRIQRHKPPKKMQGLLFPSYSDIFEYQYPRNYLGVIRITNTLKLNYTIFQEQLEEIVREIEMRIDIIPRKVEVCLDTLDPEQGRRMIHSLLPTYFDPDMLYYFENTGKKVNGPSPTGEHEYVFYRPKSIRDPRPNSERPRGGRRVCHPHIHELEIKNYGIRVHIYRCEFQLYTTYLRELMKNQKIASVSQLLKMFPIFLSRLFRFRTLNLDRLYRERPETRCLGLEPLSIRGQYYVLSENNFEPRQINRYLQKVPVPDIIVYNDFDPEEPSDSLNLYPDEPSDVLNRTFSSLNLQEKTLTPRPDDFYLHRALWFESSEALTNVGC